MTVDDVEARPQNTLEDPQSPLVVEPADAQADDPCAHERDGARWFFIAAALIALTDVVIVACVKRGLPDGLVIVALATALMGIVADLEIGPGRAASTRWDFLEDILASDGWCALAVGVLFLTFYAATVSPPTPYNEHVRLAWALLHGHTWVDAPSYMEQVIVGGRSYIL